MDIEILLNKILQTFFLPPGLSFSMMLVGLFLIRYFYATGKILLISGFVSMIILSLPITAQGLNLTLEREEALTIKQLKKSKAGAIVVLGAGRYKNSIEYPNKKDSISTNALERLRYAVYLHKKSGIPLLISGGSTNGEIISEASISQTALKEIFQIKAKWLESKSINTWNNAKHSYEILDKHGIKNIILVSHADHLLRARMSFEHFGFNVTAAPLGFKAKNRGDISYTIRDFLPSAHAMNLCSSAMHEYVGYLWYLLRYKWMS